MGLLAVAVLVGAFMINQTVMNMVNVMVTNNNDNDQTSTNTNTNTNAGKKKKRRKRSLLWALMTWDRRPFFRRALPSKVLHKSCRP